MEHRYNWIQSFAAYNRQQALCGNMNDFKHYGSSSKNKKKTQLH